MTDDRDGAASACAPLNFPDRVSAPLWAILPPSLPLSVLEPASTFERRRVPISVRRGSSSHPSGPSWPLTIPPTAGRASRAPYDDVSSRRIPSAIAIICGIRSESSAETGPAAGHAAADPAQSISTHRPVALYEAGLAVFKSSRTIPTPHFVPFRVDDQIGRPAAGSSTILRRCRARQYVTAGVSGSADQRALPQRVLRALPAVLRHLPAPP